MGHMLVFIVVVVVVVLVVMVVVVVAHLDDDWSKTFMPQASHYFMMSHMYPQYIIGALPTGMVAFFTSVYKGRCVGMDKC